MISLSRNSKPIDPLRGPAAWSVLLLVLVTGLSLRFSASARGQEHWDELPADIDSDSIGGLVPVFGGLSMRIAEEPAGKRRVHYAWTVQNPFHVPGTGSQPYLLMYANSEINGGNIWPSTHFARGARWLCNPPSLAECPFGADLLTAMAVAPAGSSRAGEVVVAATANTTLYVIRWTHAATYDDRGFPGTPFFNKSFFDSFEVICQDNCSHPAVTRQDFSVSFDEVAERFAIAYAAGSGIYFARETVPGSFASGENVIPGVADGHVAMEVDPWGVAHLAYYDGRLFETGRGKVFYTRELGDGSGQWTLPVAIHENHVGDYRAANIPEGITPRLLDIALRKSPVLATFPLSGGPPAFVDLYPFIIFNHRPSYTLRVFTGFDSEEDPKTVKVPYQAFHQTPYGTEPALLDYFSPTVFVADRGTIFTASHWEPLIGAPGCGTSNVCNKPLDCTTGLQPPDDPCCATNSCGPSILFNQCRQTISASDATTNYPNPTQSILDYTKECCGPPCDEPCPDQNAPSERFSMSLALDPSTRLPAISFVVPQRRPICGGLNEEAPTLRYMPQCDPLGQSPNIPAAPTGVDVQKVKALTSPGNPAPSYRIEWFHQNLNVHHFQLQRRLLSNGLSQWSAVKKYIPPGNPGLKFVLDTVPEPKALYQYRVVAIGETGAPSCPGYSNAVPSDLYNNMKVQAEYDCNSTDIHDLGTFMKLDQAGLPPDPFFNHIEVYLPIPVQGATNPFVFLDSETSFRASALQSCLPAAGGAGPDQKWVIRLNLASILMDPTVIPGDHTLYIRFPVPKLANTFIGNYPLHFRVIDKPHWVTIANGTVSIEPSNTYDASQCTKEVGFSPALHGDITWHLRAILPPGLATSFPTPTTGGLPLSVLGGNMLNDIRMGIAYDIAVDCLDIKDNQTHSGTESLVFGGTVLGKSVAGLGKSQGGTWTTYNNSQAPQFSYARKLGQPRPVLDENLEIISHSIGGGSMTASATQLEESWTLFGSPGLNILSITVPFMVGPLPMSVQMTAFMQLGLQLVAGLDIGVPGGFSLPEGTLSASVSPHVTLGVTAVLNVIDAIVVKVGGGIKGDACLALPLTAESTVLPTPSFDCLRTQADLAASLKLVVGAEFGICPFCYSKSYKKGLVDSEGELMNQGTGTDCNPAGSSCPTFGFVAGDGIDESANIDMLRLPAIQTHANGNVVLLSPNLSANQLYTDMTYQVFNGTNWSAPASLNLPVHIQHEPVVGRDFSGDLVAVWTGMPAPNSAPGAVLSDEQYRLALANQQIYWSKYNGSTWTIPQDISPGSLGQAKGSHVMAFSPNASEGLLVYLEDFSGDLAGDEFGLSIQRYNGSAFVPDLSFPATSALRRTPALAYLGNGSAVMVFTSFPAPPLPVPTPFIPPVESLKFAVLAGGVWSAETVLANPHNIIDFGDTVMARLDDGTGRVLCVYEGRSDHNGNGLIDPDESGAVYWTLFDGSSWTVPVPIVVPGFDSLTSVDSPQLIISGSRVVLIHHGRIGNHSAIVAYERDFAAVSLRWTGPTAFSSLSSHIQWQPTSVQLDSTTILTVFAENDAVSLLPITQNNSNGLNSRLSAAMGKMGYDLSINEVDIGANVPPVKSGEMRIVLTIRNPSTVRSNATSATLQWLDPQQLVEEPIVIPPIQGGASFTYTTGLLEVPAMPRAVQVVINPGVGESTVSNNSAIKVIVPVDNVSPSVIGVSRTVLPADDTIGLDIKIDFTEAVIIHPGDIQLVGKVNGAVKGLIVGPNKPLTPAQDFDQDGDIDEFDGSTIHIVSLQGLMADQFTLTIKNTVTDTAVIPNALQPGDFVTTFGTFDDAPGLNVRPGYVEYHTLLPFYRPLKAEIQVVGTGPDADAWNAETDAVWLLLDPPAGDFQTSCRLAGQDQQRPPISVGVLSDTVCFLADGVLEPICIDVLWKITNTDVDGDGDVDEDDVNLVREFMGSELGDPYFPQQLDLDLDGDIDENDAALVRKTSLMILGATCDGDNDYDLADLAVLFACIGQNPIGSYCDCVDFNQDHVVDGKDLATLIVGHHGP